MYINICSKFRCILSYDIDLELGLFRIVPMNPICYDFHLKSKYKLGTLYNRKTYNLLLGCIA